MIEFQDVTITFGKIKNALTGATFSVKQNEFLFLVGPSGAGKSTILHTIMGQHKPTVGEVTVGEPPMLVNKLRGDKLAALRRDIGFVFQDFKLLDHKNIYENIALAFEVKSFPEAVYKSEIEKLLRLVGIADYGLKFPGELSAGELQRVAIARAIAGGRKILLADEPTGNLDPKTAWDVMKIFKSLEGERTILIATHNIEIVSGMSKRTITLDSGQIISDK